MSLMALQAEGCFVAETGDQDNVSRLALGLERAMSKRGHVIANLWPWYFLSYEDNSACLEAAGFKFISIKLFQRLKPILSKTVGWLKNFGESSLDLVIANDTEYPFYEVLGDLAPNLKDSDDNWSVDYERSGFQALLP